MTNNSKIKKAEPYTANEIYDDLRDGLSSGRYIQGSRLRAEKFKLIYQCSASKIREVFIRLSCDGLLDSIEQKGFRVPLGNSKNRQELIAMRVMLEQEGARLSIEKGDLNWEAQVAATFHKLNHIEKKISTTGKIQPNLAVWNQAEFDFHRSIMNACGSQLLLNTHSNIYARFRQHLVGDDMSFGFRKDSVQDHRQMMVAALDRDYPRCAQFIAQNIDKDLSEGSKEQFLSTVNV